LLTLPGLSHGYSCFHYFAIDDQGRILLKADHQANPNSPFFAEDLVLLTPVPEPGSLSLMVLAMAGFAAHRVWQRCRHL
jgi:hypothetical protein